MPRYSPRRSKALQLENLEHRRLLAADVRINEIMAANESTLTDGFDQTPDWIELFNAGDESSDLAGMHLSDDIDNLNKWTFPDGTVLGAQQYLIVFASGLDTVDTNGALHSNFNLNASGDYVALSNSSLEIVSDLTDGRNFRPQFSDISLGFNIDASRIGYLTTPTPGGPNESEVVNIGPSLREVTKNIDPVDESEALRVTARVTDQYAPTAHVTLTFRAMYGGETSLPMTDNGQNGDLVANDNIFSAMIPAGTAQDGEMLRWYVSANDVDGNTSRSPAFLDDVGTDQSPEYFGTIVATSQTESQLPIFEWFIEPGTENRADRRTGTRASVFYNGEFYDNVFVRVRGNSSANLAKKSYKFDFNTGNDFRFDPDHGRVDEININTTFPNKDYIRQALAFELYDQAGVPGSEAFPIRVHQNGEFFSVAIMIEQPDADMLEREGLDPDGALYKMYNRFESASGAEKRTRDYESNADLSEFTRQVNRLEGDELRNYIFDNVNVPQMLNYLAATVIMQNNDQMAKNYFAYRDSNGTGEWSILPWDLDLSFGLHFMSNDSILDDTIYADKDDFTTFAGVTIWPSHPFVGDEAHPANRSWNRLIDALYQVPEFREMHLRRLRTLMDDMLQSPDTPTDELALERRLDEYADLIRTDAELDYQVWANPWSYGEDYSLDEAMQRMKDLYFKVRREHLFETHSIDNLNPEPPTVVIPEFATASYFVPGDDSLGTSWTTVEFNDAAWQKGETGIGFENTPRNYTDLIKTQVKPIDSVEGGTSVFMRLPFTVDSLVDVEHLTLQMKYDDGFVAYLNGTEVIRSNLRTDGMQSFDSRARSRPPALSTSYERFALNESIGLLREGENILAIHGLNSSATNSDMLFMPQLLEGKIVTSDIAGIPNRQPDNVALEFGSVVEFDPASGNQNEEYFSIRNPNDFAVDVSGWTVEGSASTTFVKGTVLPPNGELFVSSNVAAFRNRSTGPSGNQGHIVQPYNGQLSNTGDTLLLRDGSNRLVAQTTYIGNSNGDQLGLRLTEINYNPYDALTQFGELDTDNDSFEFIEIANTTADAISLVGVKLVEREIDGDSQGISFEFGEGILAPGDRIVVAKNQDAFASRYGAEITVAGEFEGKLSNGGETLTLLDANNDLIQQFRYNDSANWPSEADGDGASLVIVDTAGDYNAADNWQASRQFGGTPGSGFDAPEPTVVINEVLARTDAPTVDRIELFNATESVIDLSGWYLSDSSDYFKFTVPDGTTIAANGYVVFDETTLGFGFKGDTIDDAWLVQPDPNGKPMTLSDHILIEPTKLGESYGRVPDGAADLSVLTTPSIGARNAIRGDLNNDSIVDVLDVDLICQAIRAGEAIFDLTGDGTTDSDDLDELVQDILGTTVGDANLDGVFNSTDLVLVFQASEYEDGLDGNSTWQTGDWNCDGEFTTRDLVTAFQFATYTANSFSYRPPTAIGIEAAIEHHRAANTKARGYY